MIYLDLPELRQLTNNKCTKKMFDLHFMRDATSNS